MYQVTPPHFAMPSFLSTAHLGVGQTCQTAFARGRMCSSLQTSLFVLRRPRPQLPTSTVHKKPQCKALHQSTRTWACQQTNYACRRGMLHTAPQRTPGHWHGLRLLPRELVISVQAFDIVRGHLGAEPPLAMQMHAGAAHIGEQPRPDRRRTSLDVRGIRTKMAAAGAAATAAE